MLNTKLFDHTILKADATEAQVAKICDEALAHDFASVCVNQYYTKFVAAKLKILKANFLTVKYELEDKIAKQFQMLKKRVIFNEKIQTTEIK